MSNISKNNENTNVTHEEKDNEKDDMIASENASGEQPLPAAEAAQDPEGRKISDHDISDNAENAEKRVASDEKRARAIRRAVYAALLAALPIVSLFMSECVHSIFIYDFSPAGTIANYILFAVIYAAGVALFGTVRRSVLVMTPLIYICSVITEVILQLRGTPVLPADILSIGTGLNVASGYHFTISTGMYAGFAVLLVMMLTAWFVPLKKDRKKRTLKRSITVRLIAAALVAAVAVPFYTTDFAADHKVKPDFWDQARGYRNSGTILNFVLNTKYLIIEKPANYSASEVPGLLDGLLAANENDSGILASALKRQEENGTQKNTLLAVAGESKEDQPAQSARKKKGQVPDIIVVMNETWSDLHALGNFETNEDYLPFTRNLTKNTIKGNLYMPVVGAGTSNSEFEFLTGNSMAFLTGGSNAYELYVKSNLPSLARTLASQGYSRTGLHPYYGNSWKRSTNYPLLGFERFLSLEDIIGHDLVDAQRNNEIDFNEFSERVEALYPDENVLLRRFVSDSFDFRYLENLYRQRDPNKPFFMFNVTMQNHGSYQVGYTNFDQQIRLTSSKEYYPYANRFLSLIYESDKALSELIEYYSDVSRPTIILMFGDHQPSIETDFVEEVLGKKLEDLTLEEKQKRYVTPFVLWANYDIPEGYIDMISSNYLSTLLLQTAGLETTQYNKFLSALYKQIPVIDTTGYITADGKYYTYDDKTKYTDLLKAYEKIQYNNLFDAAGRHEELFYLNDASQQQ